MTDLTITVLYSCPLCMLRDIPVNVPARTDPDSDVVAWMQQTIVHVGHDHAARNSRCAARKLENLKIPMTNAGVDWGPGSPVNQPQREALRLAAADGFVARERSCTDKVAYTHDEAIRAARGMNKRRNAAKRRMAVYHCRFCKHYHLTSG